MKFNKFFMLGLLGLTFAACSNDDNDQMPDKDGKVYVSISIGTAKSRSLGESAAGKHNSIENLKIMFYNTADQYVPYAWNETDRAKAVQELKENHRTTITLTDVPSPAQKIYIIANEKIENQIGIGTLDEAKNTPIYLINQRKNDFIEFSNETSTLTGLEEFVDQTGDANISVELVPVTARMEVKNFIAKKAPASYLGDDIESFQVLGIYMNSFYPAGLLGDGAPIDRSQINNASDDTKYTLTYYSGIEFNHENVKTKDYSFMCNELSYDETNGTAVSAAATGTNEIWKVSPKEANKWWGYSALQGAVPHMVIKLQVKYKNITDPVTRFLTINSYKLYNTDTNVAKIERGHAYRIENCTFDATNLTEKPYETTKTITAEVTVAAWTGVEVEPEYH